jgi:DNA helicase-2/ATP-dependent DNA helicase PcrA
MEYLKQSRAYDAQIISEIFTAYQKYMKRSNFLDFDDLIGLTCKLLRQNPRQKKYYGELFQYLLVDEYQDTNAPQYELVKLLTSQHQNISVVGDEDQSIYGFRGANISNILRFEKDFPGAKIVKLEQNYRSTQVILDAATAVVSNNQHRKGKVLWTDQSEGELITLHIADDSREEALFVSHSIQRHLKDGLAGLAVLYRTNFQSRLFEESLRHLSIPYKLVGSVSFYHRQEVKDALAYLRVARNPSDDVSLARIINVPSRGIGNVTQNKLLHLAASSTCSIWEALEKALQKGVFPSRTTSSLVKFRNLIETSRTYLELPLHVSLDKILRESGYFSSLEESNSEQAQNRLLNLNELLNLAREYSDLADPLTEFLDHVALRSEADDYDESALVTLMTLHNAKGLEFPVVFLTGCEEGLFPHSRSINENDLEEERRLCYVGLTRAQQKLYITYSRRRRFFGRDAQERNRPSQFLSEIPSHLIQRSHSVELPYSPRPVFLHGEALSLPVKKKEYQGKTYNSVSSVKDFLAKRPAAKRGLKLYSGALVAHEKYGKGKVLNVEPAGDDFKVTVQFPGLGIKKFRESYAKLRLI